MPAPGGPRISSRRSLVPRSFGTMLVAGITREEMSCRRAAGTLQCQYSGGKERTERRKTLSGLHEMPRKKGSLETLVSSGFLVTFSAAKKSLRPQAELTLRPQARNTSSTFRRREKSALRLTASPQGEAFRGAPAGAERSPPPGQGGARQPTRRYRYPAAASGVKPAQV